MKFVPPEYTAAYTRWSLQPYVPAMLNSAAIYDVRTSIHLERHAWPVYELTYLHTGKTGWALDDGTRMQMTGGHCSLVQPMTYHRMVDDASSPGKYLALCIKPKPPTPYFPFSKKETGAIYSALRQAGNCVVQVRPELDGLFQALRDALARLGEQPPTPLQAVSLRMLFGHMLVDLIQSFASPPPSPHYAVIAQAKRYMELHLGDKLKVDDIARHVHYSRNRFCQMFLRETGVTPGDYRMRRRLERAQALLRESSMDLTEIAHSLGFSSSQHFSTSFKKHFTITPSAYRLQAQAESKGQGKR